MAKNIEVKLTSRLNVGLNIIKVSSILQTAENISAIAEAISVEGNMDIMPIITPLTKPIAEQRQLFFNSKNPGFKRTKILADKNP